MSEQTFTKKRSRRSPASADSTTASSDPAEEPKPEGELSPEAIESPVDPKSTLSYRLALGAVIFLGVLIVVGLGVLVVGLAKGWGHKSETPAAAAAASKQPVSMSLAPGFRILSSDTQPGRLILHVRSDTVDEYDIIDLKDGRVVARIHAEAPK